MATSRLWNTYKAIHLEKVRRDVTRTDRRVLRNHVSGKRIQ